MTYNYTYTVVNVDVESRSMEIVYTNPVKGKVHVGAPLPVAGQTLEQIVEAYSPVLQWLAADAQVLVPEVGHTGEVMQPTPAVQTLQGAKATKRAELASWRYVVATADVIVQGYKFFADFDSQARMGAALVSLQAGLAQTLDWKTASGGFASVDIDLLRQVLGAVSAQVQAAFSRERAISEQIDACLDIEAVAAVRIPTLNPSTMEVTIL